MEKSVTFTLYHQYENNILNTGTGAAKMLKNVRWRAAVPVFLFQKEVFAGYIFWNTREEL